MGRTGKFEGLWNMAVIFPGASSLNTYKFVWGRIQNVNPKFDPSVSLFTSTALRHL